MNIFKAIGIGTVALLGGIAAYSVYDLYTAEKRLFVDVDKILFPDDETTETVEQSETASDNPVV